jgi:TPR repeat protein
MQDLLKLLKEVCEGNEIAFLTLKKYFAENILSALDSANVHRYLKKVDPIHPHAIYIRAWLYEYGYGVKPDVEMTFFLMRDAASHGHLDAIYEVGRRYFYGIGIEKNILNAEKWLKYAEELHQQKASQLLMEVSREKFQQK